VNLKHDRTKALEIGIDLFWHTGYSKLGVAEICTTTGMTKGAFYNAFKSKENFLLSCIESYGKKNTAYLEEQLEDGGKKAVDRLLAVYIAMIKSQPEKDFCGCLTNNMMAEVGGSHMKFRYATSQAFDTLLEVIEPVVKQAQAEGDISSSYKPRSITELLHSAFFGIITRAKSTRDHEQASTSMTILIQSLKT
jgi:TetR/AcrR family transcriptional repressor of nem operon